MIVDFVGSPSWETGSTNPKHPPKQPGGLRQEHRLPGATVGGQGRRPSKSGTRRTARPGGAKQAPEPIAYTKLLKAAYTAVKAVDPRMKVVLGGLVGNDYPFLEQIYRPAERATSTRSGSTPTRPVTISPRTTTRATTTGRIDPYSFIAYREIHATELAQRRPRPDLDDRDELAHDHRDLLRRTVLRPDPRGSQRSLSGEVSSPGLQLPRAGALREARPVVSRSPTRKARRRGSLRENQTPKPAWSAMRTYVGARQPAARTCGDFAGPKIEVSAPTQDGALQQSAAGYHGERVRSRRRRAHPRPVATATWSKTSTSPWSTRMSCAATRPGSGRTRIPYGRQTLEFEATDHLLNVSEVRVSIVHVPAARRRHSGAPTSRVARAIGRADGSAASWRAQSASADSGRGPSPTYLAVGRIRRPSRFCSRMCADQPATRAQANIGVNSSGGHIREVEDHGRPELDVGGQHAVGLACLELRQRRPLELLGDLEARRGELATGAAQDPGARIFGPVDAVAEPHQPLPAVERVWHPAARRRRAVRPRRSSSARGRARRRAAGPERAPTAADSAAAQSAPVEATTRAAKVEAFTPCSAAEIQ